MMVQELIDRLQKFDPKATVKISGPLDDQDFLIESIQLLHDEIANEVYINLI